MFARRRRESEIELECVVAARVKGMLYLKLNVWGRKGWPDRLFVYHGRCWFVEFKRPGEDLEPIQAEVHKRLRAQGMDVVVIDNLGEFHGALEAMCRQADRNWRA